MGQQEYELWLPAAQAVESSENPQRAPYDVTIQESAKAGDFVDKYWEATETRPGMVTVKSRVAKGMGADVRSLILATQHAQTKLLMIVDPVVVDHGERARKVIDDLESALEFTLDDGVDEPADQQLAQVQAFHAQDGQRSSALSQSLRDHATLAKENEPRILEADSSFKPAIIDEAFALAAKLAAAPVEPTAASSQLARDATATRNRFLTLLAGKVRTIRSAARHVFRHHPDIVREVTSAYERRRRAALKRASKKSPQNPVA